MVLVTTITTGFQIYYEEVILTAYRVCAPIMSHVGIRSYQCQTCQVSRLVKPRSFFFFFFFFWGGGIFTVNRLDYLNLSIVRVIDDMIKII